jgi:hypothetical protein
MVTSSLTARGDARRSRKECSRGGRRTKRFRLKSVLPAALLLAALLAAPPALCLELAGGIAVPRGFYDYAANGYCEFGLYRGTLPPFASVNGRVSGYGAYRDQIGLAVGSVSLLVKLTTPNPVGGTLGLRPYVSAGPSLNYLYSWANLGDFGNISESKSSTTTSVFIGADLFSASRVRLFVEARQTLPSDFTFDYVLIGLRYAGLVLPDIE